MRRPGRSALARAALVACCALTLLGCPSEDADPDVVADSAVATDAVTTDASDTSAPTIPNDTADDATVDAPDAPDADDARDTVGDVAPPTTFPLACDGDGDCLVACGAGRCEAGRCRFEDLDDGCVVADEADATGTCVAPMALEPATGCLVCNPTWRSEGYGPVFLAVGFETGLGPLEAQNLSGSAAVWTATSQRAASGTRSAYFGDAGRETYAVGDRAWGILSTPAVALPVGAPVRLSFDLWLDTEETVGFDFLRVLVDHGDGPVEIWHSDAFGGTSYGVFLPVDVDAGVATAAGARFVFEFDTVDAKINGFEGAYIDDLRVATACCADADDCVDANPCTAGACEDGACVFSPVAGGDTDACCLVAADCDDGDACTEDRCDVPGGACTHTEIAACCSDAADCDDGDACTEDRCDPETRRCESAPLCCESADDCDDDDACTAGTCDGGQCRYVFACCEAADDCDDGDACTIDTCDAAGLCGYAFDHRPGCCRPDVLTQRFDATTALPSGWTADAASNNVGWRVQPTTMAQSGGNVLYYGHPTLSWYESGGANAGSVRSAPIAVPHGVDARLSMRVLIDVEASADRDRLTIGATVDDHLVPLLTKADLTLGAWQDVDLDVSFLAGQTVRIVARFDTVDGQGNTKLGVMIDDVRIASSCLPRPCAGDAACPSPDACIVGACVDGGCAYASSCAGP